MDTGLKPWVVALGLYRSSGGPTKTIASFREALGNAPMVNFVDPRVAAREEWAMPDADILQAFPLPGLRSWCKPSSGKLRRLETKLAGEASLISCHSFFRYHNLWTLRMKRKYGIPYWFVPHGGLDPYVMESGVVPKKTFLAAGGLSFLKQADRIIFSTEAEWQKAERQYGALNGVVIPWPVESRLRESRQEKRKAIRQKLKIQPDATVLLYFGRIHSMKRPLETIEAVAGISEKDVILVMVGPDGDLSTEDCATAAARLGYQGLRIIGPVYGEERFDYMAAADVYVSFSQRENFNHTAAESLSASLPVILSPGNDLGSEITEADCGWVMKEDTISCLKDVVRDVIHETPERLSAMGNHGADFVENQLKPSLFQQRLAELALQIGRS